MAGPRGEYRKSARRRAEILDAAFLVFSRNGYNASSVNQIAKSVGLTQTGVLHHFSGGKIALLMAILEARDASSASILEALAGRELLAGLVEVSRHQADQRGVVQLYRNVSTEAIDPEHPAHEYFDTRIRRITDTIEVAFAQVKSEGGLRPGVDPRRAALRTLAMTEGLETVWLSGLEVDMADDIEEFINGFLTEPLGSTDFSEARSSSSQAATHEDSHTGS